MIRLDDVYSGRRVLVLGGAGFIGLNLVRRLLEVGAEVRVFGHSSPAGAAVGRSILHRVEFQEGDIRDPVAMGQAVAGPGVIFNLAGRSGSSASNAAPFEDLDVNARGQLTFLEACRQRNPEARIVFASSRLVYAAQSSNPVAESAPLAPISLYGAHKLAGENYHRVYAHAHGLRTSILRMTNPYGPLQRSDQRGFGIINWFIHLAARGQPLTVYGEGSQLRDYVHVEDVAAAFLLAGADPAAEGSVFNVGSGTGVPFRQMAEMVVAAVGKGRVVTQHWPADAASVETGDFVADISAIRHALGWRPRRSLAAGIAEVVHEARAAARPEARQLAV